MNQAEVKNKVDDKKLESVMKAVDEYIYNRERRVKYAKEIVDAAEQKDVAVNLLNHLRTEFTKRPGKDEPKVNRHNLFKLAVAVGAKSFTDEDVRKTLSGLLHDISKRCQKDFIRFETQKEEFKDDFVVYLSSVRNADMTSFLNDIYEEHARKLYSKLDENFKPKYNEWLNNFSEEAEAKARADAEAKLKKEEARKRKAEERAAAKAKADAEKKDKNKGDTVMAGEKLTDEQQKELDALREKGVNVDSIKTQEDYKNKIEDLRKEGDKLDKAKGNGGDTNNNPAGNGTGGNDQGGKPVDGKDGENVDITVDGNGGNPTPAPGQNNGGSWIDQKKAEYRKRADNNEIAGYKWDDTITEGFAAYLEGGAHIHYTEKSKVTVSENAGLKVFEILVTEEHNVGKPVNFGPNLEHEQAVKLLAACLIHGNPIGKNPPQLSQEDMDLLKKELAGRTVKDKDGKDVSAFEALQEAWDKYTAKKEGNQENTDKPKTFDDETQKQVRKALNNQYEMAAMESSGLIKKLPDGKLIRNPEKDKEGNDKYSEEDFKKYLELSGKQAEDKKLLAEKFIQNPDAVRALIKELVNAKTNEKFVGRNDAEKADLAAARQAQIATLKARSEALQGAKEGTTQLDEHNDRAARVAKKRDDMSVALGIKEPSDEQKNAGIKKLEGKELSDYIKKNNISKYTYDDLLEKHNDNLKKRGKPEKKKDDAVREACKDSSNIYLAEKGNQGIG